MRVFFVDTENNEVVVDKKMDKDLETVLDIISYLDQIKANDCIYKIDHEENMYDFDSNELIVSVNFSLEI